MKKTLFLSLLVLVSTVLCALASAEEKVNVGVISELVEPFKHGELLIKETRKKLDQRLSIFYQEVVPTNAQQILDAYQHLIQVDKVDVILADGGEIGRLLTPLAEKEEQHLFLLESDIHLVQGKKFVSLFSNESGEYGRALWDLLRIQKRKKMAIIKSRLPLENQVINGITQNTIGEEKVSIELEPAKNAAAYSRLLKRLKGEGVDSIGIFLSDDAERMFLAEARKIEFSAVIYKIGSFNYLDGDAELARYPEHTLFLTPFVGDVYRQRYKDHFSTLKGVENASRFDDFLNLIADVPLAEFPFDNERQGTSGPFCAKTSSRQGSYYSFPLAIYRSEQRALVRHRLFERPS